MTHQIYKIGDDEVFSLIAEEDNFVATRPDFYIPRPGLHPSSASVKYTEDGETMCIGKCHREAYYKALETPVPGEKNVSLDMKGSLGKWDEKGVVDKWKKMGVWRGNNIKFYNKDLALSGELDAILCIPGTDRLIGVEMKTFYGYPANRSLCGVQREKGTNKRYSGRPKDDHFLQSLMYYWEYKDVVEEYRLYYLERGDGHRIEFRIGFDKRPDGKHVCWWEQIPGKYWNAYDEGKVYQPYTIEDIHDRYRTLLQLLRDRQLPDRDYEEVWSDATIEAKRAKGEIAKTKYDKWKKNPNLKSNQLGDWHCSYCDYSSICRKNDL